jgi:type II secretory pathway pseudopilin PulG
MTGGRHPRRGSRGFSYVETIVAVVIVAVALAPAIEALRPGLAGAASERAYTVNQQRLKARMEEVLANTFTVLDAAAMAAGNSTTAPVADYSDAAGTVDRLLVTMYRYDGTSQTATDTGLLRIRVAIENSVLALETLKARW